MFSFKAERYCGLRSTHHVIKGSGGVRKILWSGTGHGKRGGSRIIFYSADVDYVYLMTIYAKNQKADISAKELKVIKELIE